MPPFLNTNSVQGIGAGASTRRRGEGVNFSKWSCKHCAAAEFRAVQPETIRRERNTSPCGRHWVALMGAKAPGGPTCRYQQAIQTDCGIPGCKELSINYTGIPAVSFNMSGGISGILNPVHFPAVSSTSGGETQVTVCMRLSLKEPSLAAVWREERKESRP